MVTRLVDSILFKLVASLAVLAAGFGGCLAMGSNSPPQAPPSPAETQEVRAVRAEAESGSFEIKVDGIVAPFREIQIAAEVAGKVVEKNPACQAGKYVPAGTVLFEIDPQDYQLEVQRLEKLLSQAVVDLKELDVELDNTRQLAEVARRQRELEEAEYERLRRLASTRVISESDLDKQQRAVLNAENNYLMHSNQVRVLTTRRYRLQSGQDLVQSQLDKAQLDLARTQVVAPLNGVVVSDHVEKDSYVQRGTLLATFEDTSAVEVKCSLEMEDLYWLWQTRAGESGAGSVYEVPNVPVKVIYRVTGRDNVRYQWTGELSHYDGIGVDERTRTVPCTITVADPGDVTAIDRHGQPIESPGPPALVRGMFVNVKLVVPAKTTLLRIPEEAVRPGKMLWVVRKDKLQIMGPITL